MRQQVKRGLIEFKTSFSDNYYRLFLSEMSIQFQLDLNKKDSVSLNFHSRKGLTFHVIMKKKEEERTSIINLTINLFILTD